MRLVETLGAFYRHYNYKRLLYINLQRHYEEVHETMRIRKEKKGFSLVELMIVVAIIAILAAIAIPSFMRFAMKSKTSEATGNLSAIRTAEESYRAEEDTYTACAGNPSGWTGGDGAATPDAWDAGVQEWEDIGFAPDGNVRYQYEVTIGDTDEMTILAEGDLDEDGAAAGAATDVGAGNAQFRVSNDDAQADAVAIYPKPIKEGDDF